MCERNIYENIYYNNKEIKKLNDVHLDINVTSDMLRILNAISYKIITQCN